MHRASFLPDPITETGGRLFPKPPKALQSLPIHSTLLAAVQHMAKVLPDTLHVLHTSANLQRLSPEPRARFGQPHLCEEPHGMRRNTVQDNPAPDRRSCTSPASKTLVGFASLIASQSLHHLLRQVWLKKHVCLSLSISIIASSGHLAVCAALHSVGNSSVHLAVCSYSPSSSGGGRRPCPHAAAGTCTSQHCSGAFGVPTVWLASLPSTRWHYCVKLCSQL